MQDRALAELIHRPPRRRDSQRRAFAGNLLRVARLPRYRARSAIISLQQGITRFRMVQVRECGAYTVPEIAAIGLTESQIIAQHGAAILGRTRFDEVARGRMSAADVARRRPKGRTFTRRAHDRRGRERARVHRSNRDGCDEWMIAGLGIDTFIETVISLAEAFRVPAFDVLEQREGDVEKLLGSHAAQGRRAPRRHA